MSISDKLNVLVENFCHGRRQEFADAIGISVQAFGKWFIRDAIDYKKVADAFPQVSAEWLLRDEGNMIKSKDYEAHEEYESPIFDAAMASVSELADDDSFKHSDTVTIPIELLNLLKEQIKVKDNQISTLMNLINKN